MRHDRYEYHPYDARSNIPAPTPVDKTDWWINLVQITACALMVVTAIILIIL